MQATKRQNSILPRRDVFVEGVWAVPGDGVFPHEGMGEEPGHHCRGRWAAGLHLTTSPWGCPSPESECTWVPGGGEGKSASRGVRSMASTPSPATCLLTVGFARSLNFSEPWASHLQDSRSQRRSSPGVISNLRCGRTARPQHPPQRPVLWPERGWAWGPSEPKQRNKSSQSQEAQWGVHQVGCLAG